MSMGGLRPHQFSFRSLRIFGLDGIIRQRNFPDMSKLKRLKINKYRNVVPGTELHFHDGINILLGKNASGKTTLLNLISLCLGVPQPEEEEYWVEYDLELISIDEDRSSETHLPLKLTINTRSNRLKQNSTEEPLTYERATTLTVDGISITSPTSPLSRSFAATLFNAKIPEITGRIWYETLRNICRFDESLQLFNCLIGSELLDSYNSRFVPFLNMLKTSPTSNEFTSIMLPRETFFHFSDSLPDVRFTNDQFPFLQKITKLLGFSSVEMSPRFLERKATERGEQSNYRGLSFRFSGSNKNEITERLLSYGQKRLLAFYYYLALNPSIVIADELVNGLHHKWIENCLAEIGSRQAFLTSQNPLLLDYMSFESATEARTRFILCESQPSDNRTMLSWRNMSDEEATMFFDAYEAGIEHVGEILITRNLF